MNSSPPAKAPKLQLAIEQPSTGGFSEDTREPTKKRYLMSKDKGEASTRQLEGCDHDKIKSHTHPVDDPQTGE